MGYVFQYRKRNPPQAEKGPKQLIMKKKNDMLTKWRKLLRTPMDALVQEGGHLSFFSKKGKKRKKRSGPRGGGGGQMVIPHDLMLNKNFR